MNNYYILYKILKYKIYLYFVDYKIAVECDEYNHKDRSKDNEQKRQEEITKELNCKWIRYNPNAKDFDIFIVVHDIYELIKASK